MKYLGVGVRGGRSCSQALVQCAPLDSARFFIFRFSYVNYINET